MKKWTRKPFFGCPHCMTSATHTATAGDRVTWHFRCGTVLIADKEHMVKPKPLFIVLYGISGTGFLASALGGDIIQAISWSFVLVGIWITAWRIGAYEEE